jgi:hypothetical protein
MTSLNDSLFNSSRLGRGGGRRYSLRELPHISGVKIFFGAQGSVVVEALCYEPDGSGFDSRGH